MNKRLAVYGSVFLSVFVLSFAVGSFFMLPSGTNAAEGDTDVNINVASVISVTASTGNLAMEMTPTAAGAEATGDVTLTVGTNNATGYTLTMNARTAAERDLTHSNGTNKIMNSGNVTAAALGDNTWGYNLKTGATPTSFLSIPAPTAPATLTTTTALSANSATVVTVGARANTSIPSGVYSGVLTFTAVGNYVPEPPQPPVGYNPGNISSTNPGVWDVYPTTGWEGDIIAITSNELFANVEINLIQINAGGGGFSMCDEIDVVNSSLLTCRLPEGIAGMSGNISIYGVDTSSGGPVTSMPIGGPGSHMKITYFDPDSNEVDIDGTDYAFYPNGFTSADCSSLTPSNAAITATPASSMAYFRDTRNKQTYKVKKMADGKCWMVDNLKYADSNMTFNNGDHLNNGGTGAYNTIDESSTQSDTNSNKAFYNNPMSSSYCYNLSSTIANTLTHCGYQYNWYAATNGTGTYAQSTQGTNVTGNICPANFRLPSGMSNGSTATSNGTSYAASDFSVLNASMNAGSLTTGSTSNYYAGWQPSGAWGGTFSGYLDNALVSMGSGGNFWSSTVSSSGFARNLYFDSGRVYPGYGANSYYYGFAVRCVLP